MPKDSHIISASWRRPLWAATLVAASLAFSLGFACAVPLAAFAAVAVLTANRSEALFLIIAVFLANQCVGFGLLHYPWTAETFAWGGVLGFVAIAAVFGAGWAGNHLHSLGPILVAGTAFLTAFAIYEGLLLVATAISGSGFEAYTVPIIARIFAINATAFLALLALRRLMVSAGVADLAAPHLMTQGPL